MAHHGEVVGDEHVGHSELLLQILQKVHDLGLHRHVQRRDRLVAHDQPGPRGQRPRNADALALAARELMGVALGVVGVQAHGLEQLGHQLLGRGARGDAVQQDRLHQRLAHRHARVERAERVLEHHLHVPARALQAGGGQRDDVLAIEHHRAAVRLQQAQQGPAGGGLAAAALAHDGQRFARADREGHVGHRLHGAGGALEHARFHREVLGQVADLENGGAHAAASSMGARQQATERPGPISFSGGGAARQWSVASGQRPAKRQPGSWR